MKAQLMPGHLIRRLNQISAHEFARQTQAAGFDITPVQFAAMDTISANPGIDQAGVAANIAYDRATIGGVIDRLVQKGTVERTVSKRDRRAREVKLTKSGQRILDDVLPIVTALQEDILPGLSPEERGMFLSLAFKAISNAKGG
ncbi:MAG: MarR family winged helix-turn-helix transcriptional regulator [Pelagimonas sp.]|uniref:MarR family winged helix-turn-helix transcriptional regulator n=1 Tax=Pelagimonas sp. TaxID=2073170 RepID=UPI003D6B2946